MRGRTSICSTCASRTSTRSPKIPGSTLIPLGQLGARYGELPPASSGKEIIIHCKSGVRSAKAVNLLKEHGIEAKNLKGGILAWIDRIDPSQPKY